MDSQMYIMFNCSVRVMDLSSTDMMWVRVKRGASQLAVALALKGFRNKLIPT